MKRLAFGLTLATFALITGRGAAVQAKTLETLDDACSGDVVVKVPWAEDNAPSLDSGDIVLARSKAFCDLVEGSTSEPPKFKGRCQHNPTKKSNLTDPIAYSSIRNGDWRFRWFCGKTAERSRCPKETRHVRFRIGPDRLFQTLCLD